MALAHSLPKETGTPGAPRPRRWRRRLAALVAVLALLAVLAVLLLTDAKPSAENHSAPTADQVGAGRDAIYQIRAGQHSATGASQVRIGPAQLDGLSAMASYGYRPSRFDMYTHKGVFYATVSLPLPLDRWLNVNLYASELSHGFPQIRMRVGSVSFSPAASRYLLDLTRWVFRKRGIALPPLDKMVRDFVVDDETVVATVQIPIETIVQHQAAEEGGPVDPMLVARTFCRLSAAQQSDPQADFAIQIRRAFPISDGANATADTNRAALVALAMFIVDRRIGEMANVSDAQTARCATKPTTAITLHGRSDLPKHWSLSAALAALTGVQLAEAMGEWKELADSLSKASQFQPGDPSGFSFVDIAADRSGFHVARGAISLVRAGEMARRLSLATDAGILPSSLLEAPDGLTAAEFKARYGNIADPRYLETVRQIDDVLWRDSLLGR